MHCKLNLPADVFEVYALQFFQLHNSYMYVPRESSPSLLSQFFKGENSRCSDHATVKL